MDLLTRILVDRSALDAAMTQMKADAAAVVQNFSSLHGQLQPLTTSLNQMGSALQTAGIAATAFGAALIAPLALGIKSAIDFEAAFQNVRRTVDGSEESLDKLSRRIRDMSTEIPVSAVQLAKIAEIAGQLGIEGAENVGKFTESISKVSTITDLTVEAAARGFSRMAAIMGEPIENVDKMASSLVLLGVKSSATESEILSMAERIAGAGKVVGLTTAEVLSISAALSSLGIAAELGGTAVNRMLMEMNKAVQEGSDSLRVFSLLAGTSVEGFKTLFDTKPAEAFVKVIEGLKAAGKDAVVFMEGMGGEGVRLAQVLLSAAGAGDKLRNTIELGNQGYISGKEHLDRYGTQVEAAAHQLTILWNRINELGRVVGDMFLPMIKAASSALGEFILWAREHETLVQVAGAIAAIVGSISVLGGGLLILLGTLATSVSALLNFASVLGALQIAGVSLGSMFTTLGTIIAGLLTGPAGWIALTTAAVVLFDQFVLGGVITQTLWSAFTGLLGVVKDLAVGGFDLLSAAMGVVLDVGKSVLSWLGDLSLIVQYLTATAFTDLINAISGPLVTAWQGLVGVVSDTESGIGDVISVGLDWVDEMTGWREALGLAEDAAGTLLTSLKSLVSDGFAYLMSIIKPATDAVVDWWNRTLAAAREWKAGNTALVSSYEDVVNATFSTADAVVKATEKAGEATKKLGVLSKEQAELQIKNQEAVYKSTVQNLDQILAIQKLYNAEYNVEEEVQFQQEQARINAIRASNEARYAAELALAQKSVKDNETLVLQVTQKYLEADGQLFQSQVALDLKRIESNKKWTDFALSNIAKIVEAEVQAQEQVLTLHREMSEELAALLGDDTDRALQAAKKQLDARVQMIDKLIASDEDKNALIEEALRVHGVKVVQIENDKTQKLIDMQDNLRQRVEESLMSETERVREEYAKQLGLIIQYYDSIGQAFGTYNEAIEKLRANFYIKAQNARAADVKDEYDAQVAKMKADEEAVNRRIANLEFINNAEQRRYDKLAQLLIEEGKLHSDHEVFVKGVLLRIYNGFDSTWDGIGKIVEGAARSMSSTLSDLFFDVLTGNLKSAEDYFKQFFNAVLRSITDFLAQQATKALIKFIFDLLSDTPSQAASNKTGIFSSFLSAITGGGGSGTALANAMCGCQGGGAPGGTSGGGVTGILGSFVNWLKSIFGGSGSPTDSDAIPPGPGGGGGIDLPGGGVDIPQGSDDWATDLGGGGGGGVDLGGGGNPFAGIDVGDPQELGEFLGSSNAINMATPTEMFGGGSSPFGAPGILSGPHPLTGQDVTNAIVTGELNPAEGYLGPSAGIGGDTAFFSNVTEAEKAAFAEHGIGFTPQGGLVATNEAGSSILGTLGTLAAGAGAVSGIAGALMSPNFGGAEAIKLASGVVGAANLAAKIPSLASAVPGLTSLASPISALGGVSALGAAGGILGLGSGVLQLTQGNYLGGALSLGLSAIQLAPAVTGLLGGASAGAAAGAGIGAVASGIGSAFSAVGVVLAPLAIGGLVNMLTEGNERAKKRARNLSRAQDAGVFVTDFMEKLKAGQLNATTLDGTSTVGGILMRLAIGATNEEFTRGMPYIPGVNALIPFFAKMGFTPQEPNYGGINNVTEMMTSLLGDHRGGQDELGMEWFGQLLGNLVGIVTAKFPNLLAEAPYQRDVTTYYKRVLSDMGIPFNEENVRRLIAEGKLIDPTGFGDLEMGIYNPALFNERRALQHLNLAYNVEHPQAAQVNAIMAGILGGSEFAGVAGRTPFDALVVQGYRGILRRDPEAGAVDAWVQALMGGMGLPSFYANLIHGAEFGLGTRNLYDVVGALYNGTLGRLPSNQEALDWILSTLPREDPAFLQAKLAAYNEQNAALAGTGASGGGDGSAGAGDGGGGGDGGFAAGGWVPGQGSGDIVPMMLEPGEFVMRRRVAQRFPMLMDALNNERVPMGARSGGGSMTVNISIIVNGDVRDPQELARSLTPAIRDELRRMDSRYSLAGSKAEA